MRYRVEDELANLTAKQKARLIPHLENTTCGNCGLPTPKKYSFCVHCKDLVIPSK